jgi:hypothetical protein
MGLLFVQRSGTVFRHSNTSRNPNSGGKSRLSVCFGTSYACKIDGGQRADSF